MDLRSHRTRTRLLAVTAVLVLGGLSACSGDDSTASPKESTTTEPTGAGDAVVAQGIAFANDLTVAAGQDFTFDNQADTAHTLTADDGSFDSGTVPGGNQSGPITAPTVAGQYPFHCEIHPSMTGTLTVE